MTTVLETDLPSLFHKAKVRDTYDIGDGLLLMIATDRISAFDVVLPTGIPEKGAVLSQLSAFWFDKTKHIVPNHFVNMAYERNDLSIPDELAKRAMVVQKAERIDIECVARGYITGSAWAEYRASGTVNDRRMPQGMVEGDRFPDPIFTPAAKSDNGHDINISVEHMADMVGDDLTDKLSKLTLTVYKFAHDFARKKGIMLADTKLEFGFIDGRLSLIDELLTPDSSRFWDAEGYEPGKTQPNYDKQFVRNWLNSQGWDHEPPAPELPNDIIEKTRERYLEAFRKLTGNTLS